MKRSVVNSDFPEFRKEIQDTKYLSKYITFIKAIQDRPWLWNEDHQDFAKKEKCQNSWRELGQMLGCSAFGASNKWMYFKEQFLKELTKPDNNIVHSNNPDDFVTDWPYFKSLFFLKDIISTKEQISNARELRPFSRVFLMGGNLIKIEEVSNDAFLMEFPEMYG